MIGYDLHVSKQGIGYSNLTPDPGGGASGVKKKNPSGGARKTREAGFLVDLKEKFRAEFFLSTALFSFTVPDGAQITHAGGTF